MRTKIALAVGVAVLLQTVQARADNCERLVNAVDVTTTRTQGGPTPASSTFSVPSTSGEWYLTLLTDGSTSGSATLNGVQVFAPSDLKAKVMVLRKRVTVNATNTLVVDVAGKPGSSIRALVQGVVPASALPVGTGLHVFRRTFFDQTFAAGTTTASVPLANDQGIFSIVATNGPGGSGRASSARVSWGGREIFSPSDFSQQTAGAEAPVLVSTANTLVAEIQAPKDGGVRIQLSGIMIDEEAPRLDFVSPPSNTWVGTKAELVVQYGDTISGLAGTPTFTLNGQDVTAKIAATTSQATATLASLKPPLVTGSNQLQGSVRDNACNETTRSITVLFDDLPPVIEIEKPGEGVLAGGPTTPIVFSFTITDAHSGVNEATRRAYLDGVEITGSFSFSGGRGTATLVVPRDGEHFFVVTAEDLVSNSARAERRFTIDGRGPNLSIRPRGVVGEAQPAIFAIYSDPPIGSGVALSTLELKIDGVAQVPFVVLGSSAVFFPEAPLSAGDHVISARIADNAGNTTQVTETLTVELGTKRFELSIAPSDSSSVALLSLNDLTIRAVTEHGALDPNFTGPVRLNHSSGLMPLDGMIVEFLPGHQGVLKIRELAIVRTLGPQTLTATALGDSTITGTLTMNGVSSVPTWHAESITRTGEVTIIGTSPLGPSTVDVLVDGVVVQTTTTNDTGAFVVRVVLPPGVHIVRVRVSNGTVTLTSASQQLGPSARLRGLVLDGATLGGAPLAGVVVRVEGTSLATVTNTDGEFTLEPVGAGDRVLTFDGSSIGFGYHRVHALASGDSTVGAVTLRRLNPAHTTTAAFSSPGVSAGFTVSNTDLLTRLEVPAGTLIKTPARTPPSYTIQQVLPGDLPVNFPTLAAAPLAFSFQPEGVDLKGPIVIRFPNDPGLAPFESTAVWRYVPESGEWEVAGEAVATADARELVYQPDWTTGTYVVDLGPPKPGQQDFTVLVSVLDRKTGSAVPAKEVALGATGLVRTRIDEQGVFVLTIRAFPGEKIAIRATRIQKLKPAATGFAQLTLTSSPTKVGLLLDAPTTLTGTVVENHFGRAVVDAEVRVGDQVTRTGLAGEFKITANLNLTNFGDPNATSPTSGPVAITVSKRFATATFPSVTVRFGEENAIGSLTLAFQNPDTGTVPPQIRTVASRSGNNGSTDPQGLLLHTLAYSPLTGSLYTVNRQTGDQIVEVRRNLAPTSLNWTTLAGGFANGLFREGVSISRNEYVPPGQPGSGPAPNMWAVEGTLGDVWQVALGGANPGAKTLIARGINPSAPPTNRFPLAAPFLFEDALLLNLDNFWWKVMPPTQPGFNNVRPEGTLNVTTDLDQSLTRNPTGNSFFLSRPRPNQAQDPGWEIVQLQLTGGAGGSGFQNPPVRVVPLSESSAVYMQMDPSSTGGVTGSTFYVVKNATNVPGVGPGGTNVVKYEVESSGTIRSTVMYQTPTSSVRIFGLLLAPTQDFGDHALYVLQSNIQEGTTSPTANVLAEIVEIRFDPTYLGTLPNPSGSDDPDFLLNSWEQALGTNPAVADTDGDGVDDYLEFIASTNPFGTDNSAFEIERSFPQTAATGAFLDTPIFVDFTAAVDPASLLVGMRVLGPPGPNGIPTQVPGRFVPVAGSPRRAEFVPSSIGAFLQPFTTYLISADNRVRTPSGARLAFVYEFRFRTGTELASQVLANGLLAIEGAFYGDPNYDPCDPATYTSALGVVNGTFKGRGDPELGQGGPDSPIVDNPIPGDPDNPLSIIGFSPISGSSGVATTNALITIKFNGPVKPADLANPALISIALTEKAAGGDVQVAIGPRLDPQDPSLVLLNQDPSGQPVVLNGGAAHEVEVTVGGVTRTCSFTTETPETPTPPKKFEPPHYNPMAPVDVPQQPYTPAAPCPCCCVTNCCCLQRSGLLDLILSNGSAILSFVDFSIPGRSPAVTIARTYRSNGESVGSRGTTFGPNWYFNYDRQFELAGPLGGSGSALVYTDSDGRTYTFPFDPTATATAGGRETWASPTGLYYKVQRVRPPGGPTGYLARIKDSQGDVLLQRDLASGMRYYYAPFPRNSGDVARLMWIEDANEEAIQFERNPKGRITKITDTIGRITNLAYDAAGEKVVMITDHAKRTWSYSYRVVSLGVTAELERVDTPSVIWSEFDPATGNLITTPTETPKVTDFEYAPGSLLVTVGVRGLQPNGTLAGKGKPGIRLMHGANGEILQYDFGKGTAFQSYDFRNGNATQVDRSGAVTKFEHSSDGQISASTQFTRGLRSFAQDPVQYVTNYQHDPDTLQLKRVVKPKGNVATWEHDKTTGSLRAATLEDGLGKVLRTTFDYERPGFFNRIKRVTEARGHDPAVLGRALSPAEAKDSLTTHFFYDHEYFEDTPGEVNAINQAHDEMGIARGTVWDLSSPLLKSYGRLLGTRGYSKPDRGVFADKDGDGLIDRGGNLYVIRGPRPTIVEPAAAGTGNAWQFSTSPQVIETYNSYNKFGQILLTVSPAGVRTRYRWNNGKAFSLTDPDAIDAGYLRAVEHATKYKDSDLTADDLDAKEPSVGRGSDAGGLDLTTELRYDAVGNTMEVVDPEGRKRVMMMDKLNLMIEETSPSGYMVKHAYDGRNSRIQDLIEDKIPNDTNDNGVEEAGERVSGGPDFDHRYHYNDVNSLEVVDVDARKRSAPSVRVALRTVYQLDEQQRVVATRQPEGNVHTVAFDERGLVLETIAGASDPTTSQRTRFAYDWNGNLERVYDDDGNNTEDRFIEYDFAERAFRVREELGQYTQVAFDAAGNVVELFRMGELGRSGTATSVLLAHAVAQFDEAGRPYQRARRFFDALNATTIPRPPGALVPPEARSPFTPPVYTQPSQPNPYGTYVFELMQFHRDGAVDRMVDDNGHMTEFEYDAARRPRLVRDAAKNELIRAFDRASNVVLLTEREKASDDPSTIAGTYYTQFLYDAEDRVVEQIRHGGNTVRFLYDSRSNVLQTSDAMGSANHQSNEYELDPRNRLDPATFTTTPLRSSSLNGRGNTVRFVHDGLSRLVETHRQMRSDGTGAGALEPSKEIITYNTWDKNSRLAAQTDGESNETSYCYDHQNRLIKTHFANGTERHLTWVDNTASPPSRVDTLKLSTDARGVVRRFSYDANERRSRLEVTGLPSGVGQTTTAKWTWDGLDRLVEGEDDDTLVQFDYDSLGNRTAELQRVTTLQGSFTFRVGSSFDGVGNKTGINYPGLTAGTYVGPAAQPLTQTFDALDRLESIRDNLATPIATYKHVGMGARRTERTFRSTATLSCLYDENRRITDYMHTMRNSGSLRFHYTWDRESNRRVEIETRSYSTGTAQEQSYIGRSYEYDSIYRLKNDQRNVPGAQLQSVPSNAVSVLPITGTNLATYDLDRANNRRSVQIDGISQAYFSDAADPLRDKSVNQYSRVGGIAMSHDRAGNQLSGAELADQRFFDCNDQLVQLVNTVRSTDTRYRYDVLGRRLAKYSASASFPEILFVHDGAEVLEELTPGPSGTVTLLRRFVYGERIDEPLRVTSRDAADLNRNGSVSDYVDLWYHENSIGSIVALSDDNGNVVESYRYRAYGDLDEIRDRDNQLVLDANGRLDASRVKNPYTFQGRRLDFEEGSGLMHFRARYYDPKLGRFISRDPLGVWGDRSQLGNAQSAFGNNPVNVTDPTGLGWWDDINATYHIVKGVVTGDPNEVLMGAAKLAGIKNIPSAPEVRMGGGATKPPRGTEPTKEELMRPGPYAGKGTKVEPVEGRGRSFTAEQRRSVNAEGDKLGCHTCGKETSGRKSGNWTPDHQPPTTGDTAYPHCERCSAKQGGHLSKGPAPGTSKGAGPSTPKGPEKPNAPNSSGPGTPKKPGFFGRLGGTALCVFNFVGLIQMGIDYPSWKPGMGLGLIGGTDPRTGEYKSPNLHDLLGIPNEWLLDPERNLPPEEKQKRAMERFLAGGKDRT